jgi:hypothetical protein
MLRTPLVAAAMVAFGFASPSHAFPASGATQPAQSSEVQQIASRCYWHNGHRHCANGRVMGYRAFGHRRYRGHGVPENYRTGSRRWFEEMERTDRVR